VTYEDINGSVRQLAYANINGSKTYVDTPWGDGIQAGNFTLSGGNALGMAYTPVNNSTVGLGPQNETLFGISNGVIQAQMSAVDTAAIFTASEFNKTWISCKFFHRGFLYFTSSHPKHNRVLTNSRSPNYQSSILERRKFIVCAYDLWFMAVHLLCRHAPATSVPPLDRLGPILASPAHSSSKHMAASRSAKCPHRSHQVNQRVG